MSYLGRGLEQVDNISKLDNITFNGGTTYALTKDSAAFTPISSNAILISIDGVVQQGNFSVSGTNIVFNFSPTSSNTCDFIMHYGTGVAFTPADSSITKDKANFISTSSSAGLQIKGDGTTDGTLQLNCSQNSHGVKIKSPAHSAGQSYTLTLPTTAPAANKMLQTDGSGNLSFVDAPSGGLVPLAQIASSSDVATVALDSFMDSSSYAYYKVFAAVKSAGNGVTLEARFRDGGSALNANNYYYANHIFIADIGIDTTAASPQNSASLFTDGSTSTAIFEFTIFPDNGIGNQGLSSCFWRSSDRKYNSNTRKARTISGAFQFVNDTVPDGFHIHNDSGNFEDYAMYAYGVKKYS